MSFNNENLKFRYVFQKGGLKTFKNLTKIVNISNWNTSSCISIGHSSGGSRG